MERSTKVRLNRHHYSAGFTMAEVVLALAVVAFGLIAVLGVLPVGMNTTRDNKYETMIIQDVGYWMNGIRGGRLGTDALNNVEWIEVTVRRPNAEKGSEEEYKTYRADYATLWKDPQTFELDELVPTDAKMTAEERAVYTGQLKQAGWRKDVIGWLSIINGTPDGFGNVVMEKRAKIRPLGATLMNQLHGKRDDDGSYIHGGGDLTFSYLLETKITKISEDAVGMGALQDANVMEIELKASWPIIEEKVNPKTGKFEVKTGPGKRAFIGYIMAPFDEAWCGVDVEKLDFVKEVSVGVGFVMKPSFVFNNIPAGERINKNSMIEHMISMYWDGDTGIHSPAQVRKTALGEFLGRSESLPEMEKMLAGLDGNASFVEDLKFVLHTHGIFLDEQPNIDQQGGGVKPVDYGGIVGGLNSTQAGLGQVGRMLEIDPSVVSVEGIMLSLNSLEAQNMAIDNLYASLGIDLNALMADPLLINLVNTIEKLMQNGQGNVDIMALLNQYYKQSINAGNGEGAQQSVNLSTQLVQLGKANSNLGLPSDPMSAIRQAGQARQRQASNQAAISRVKQTLKVDTMSEAISKLNKWKQDVKLAEYLSKILEKHKDKMGESADGDDLIYLTEAMKLKSQIIGKLISPLLEKALVKLEKTSSHPAYVRSTDIDASTFLVQVEPNDSLSRYSMMHNPRTIKDYLYPPAILPLDDGQKKIWDDAIVRIEKDITISTDFLNIQKGQSWGEMRELLWKTRGKFKDKLDVKLPEVGSNWDYFRVMGFFRPQVNDN